MMTTPSLVKERDAFRDEIMASNFLGTIEPPLSYQDYTPHLWLVAAGSSRQASAIITTMIEIEKVVLPSAMLAFCGFGHAGKLGFKPLHNIVIAAVQEILVVNPRYASHAAIYSERQPKPTRFGWAVESTARLVLSHLWDVWRVDIGLSISTPYLFRDGAVKGLRYYPVTEFVPDFPYSSSLIAAVSELSTRLNGGKETCNDH